MNKNIYSTIHERMNRLIDEAAEGKINHKLRIKEGSGYYPMAVSPKAVTV